MRVLYTLCFVITLFYLVSACEDQTHYFKDGTCCKKCGPGKRMLMKDNCEDPICQDCEDGEYQSGYTTDTKCKLQPSCDTNLHFLPQANPIPKDVLSKCQCKPGFYCTEDDDCSICRQHKVCKAGEKIVKNGTSVSNTVCEACNSETFSISESSDTCKEWTICESGYTEKTPGSLTSDRICEKGKPIRGVLWVILGILLILLAAVAVMIFIKKRSNKWKQIPKEAVMGTRINLPKENQPFINNPVTQQPEEDVDNSAPVSPTPSNITERGNFVTQEEGKQSICPSTETQPFSENSIL